MTNIRLASIEQYVDVSSKNNYYNYHLKEDPERRLHRIHLSSRDSARTPMQWDDSEHAGFSTAEPWFYVNPNYKKINVARQQDDEYSILNFYRKCLKLRKSSKTLIYGEYKEYFPKDKNIYMYERRLGDECYLIICSFSRLPVKLRLPDQFAGRTKELVLCNYPENVKDIPAHRLKRVSDELLSLELDHGMMRPYEARIYRF